MEDSLLARQLDDASERLLDNLFDASLDPALWARFLQTLVQATESRSARLLILNETANQVHHSIKVNIDDNDHQRYVEHYVNTCPWRLELGTKQPGQLYSTYHDFSCRQPAFYKTEFFNDWARDLNIHHGVCGTVYQAGGHKVQLLIQRTQDQGAYSQKTTRLINGLLPHVRQALRMSQQHQAQIGTLKAACDSAENRGLPFMLLDRTGRLCHLSQRCERLFAQGDLGLQEGTLHFQDPNLQQRFQQAFAQVSARAASCQSQEALLNIHRRGRPRLRCILTPIHPLLATLWPTEAFIAVYIHDPEQAFTIDQRALIELYSLTESEARIAIDIALGLDPQFIAERDNRSTHTVRAQLKSVFNKTRCNRQNQLAALILQSPAARQR